MLPSKIDQMKVSHETGSIANFGSGCAFLSWNAASEGSVFQFPDAALVLAALPSHSVFLFNLQYCSVFITLLVIAALLSLVSSSSLSSHFVLPCFLISTCVSWINPCLAVRTLFGLLLMFLEYPSSQALWILILGPMLALGLLVVLPVLYLFADVLTLPVFLTTSWNKVCKWICMSHVSFARLH